MQRPSITFLNRVYPPGHGATGRLLRDLARSFAREGWRVTIITSGEDAGRQRDGAIRVIRVKGAAKPHGVLAYMWVMLKMMVVALRQPADHVLVSMTDPPLLVVIGGFIARIKGMRHMHWCQDLYPDLLPVLGVKMPSALFNFARYQVRKAMARCDKIIVIGRCMARELTQDGFDPRQITFIPNWPNAELCMPDGMRRKNVPMPASQQYKDDDSQQAEPRFRVLYAGNLGLAHPMDVLLDAAALLQATDPVIEFVFVGEGARYDALAQERSRRTLDNVRLLPYQPDARLRELMESGDVHLISMAEDAAGLLVPSKIYSALAVHRPCVFVGPSGSEVAKLLQDFDAGSVIAPDNAQALANAIRAYVRSAKQWHTAHEGARKASAVYVPKESIEAWINRAWMVVKSEVR